MTETRLDALLSRIDKIAKAVNSFSSDAVQQRVFDTLIAAFDSELGPAKTTQPPRAPTGQSTADAQSQQTGAKRSGSSRKRREAPAAKGPPKLIRDLNLRPAGKPSFDDFVAEKQPRDNQEKFLLAIYYLEQMAGIQPVTDAHVGTVFRMTSGWREPGNLGSGLRMTAHRKNTIDTSNLEDLKTTPHGRNFVEHDLPHQKKTK